MNAEIEATIDMSKEQEGRLFLTLERFPEEVARRVIEFGGLEETGGGMMSRMHDDAVMLAPIDTGLLSTSIRLDFPMVTKGRGYSIYSRRIYIDDTHYSPYNSNTQKSTKVVAYYQDRGFEIHNVYSKRFDFRSPLGQMVKFRKLMRVSRHTPFLTPAFESNIERFREYVNDAMKEVEDNMREHSFKRRVIKGFGGLFSLFK